MLGLLFLFRVGIHPHALASLTLRILFSLRSARLSAERNFRRCSRAPYASRSPERLALHGKARATRKGWRYTERLALHEWIHCHLGWVMTSSNAGSPRFTRSSARVIAGASAFGSAIGPSPNMPYACAIFA